MVTRLPSSHTLLDGHPGERTVPFGGNSLQHGTAVFDGIRAYATDSGPLLFRPAEHVRRLLSSADTLGIGHRWSFEDVLALVVRAAARESGDSYVRPVLFARDPYLGVDLRALEFTLGVEVWPIPPPTVRPARLTVSPWRRPAPSSFPPAVKATGTYAVSAVARTHAGAAGFDDAIQLDPGSGRVAEATIANVFLVRGRRLLTPWPRESLLPGITRDTVLRLAASLGIEAHEGPVDVGDLAAADEVFLTGTASELVPVGSVDAWTYPAPGPVFTELAAAFRDAVTGRLNGLGWCVPVSDRRQVAH